MKHSLTLDFDAFTLALKVSTKINFSRLTQMILWF